MKSLNNYYNKIIEGDRLFKSKANSIEFYTTCHFIKRYISIPNKIIELGAGYGTYSFYFAQKGFEVLATDIVEENVKEIRKIIPEEFASTFKCSQLDATNMESISDNDFDTTLCLGPLYHLRSSDLRKKCIEEAIRITRKEGYIFFAYINRNFAIPYLMSLGVKFSKSDYEELKKANWDYSSFPDNFMNVSYFSTPEQILDELKYFEIQIISHVAVDGPYTMLKNKVEELTDDEFENLLNYHISVAEIQSYLGSGSHNMIICKKL